MARHRQDFRASKKISQYQHSNDVVDMEVGCVCCKTRLYVPYTALDAVLASLRRAGGAILICHACGQAQLVSGTMPQKHYVND
jgi:G3E family GTPase